MGRPAIGITAALEHARWTVWEDVVALSPRSYARAVQRAGGVALLLPPDPGAEDDPGSLCERMDALLLSGGADVDPSMYGAERHPATQETWPERDRFEITLARAALAREMPVLGICRGMQLLNVALGGTLVQHLPDVIGSQAHRYRAGEFGEHEVRLEPGSLAARAVGAERTLVRSHHHQGAGRLGAGLVASGWSVDDDVVEAIELPGERFALGVLWHPEEDERSRVVAALVEAARAPVGERR